MRIFRLFVSIITKEGLEQFLKPFKKSIDDSFVEASFEVDLVAIE